MKISEFFQKGMNIVPIPEKKILNGEDIKAIISGKYSDKEIIDRSYKRK
ncbi:hypothetical protein LCGC14_0504780 [marine sediment metagenome]|uniref:Uncharacterized protein n=1 Tax=marine sediment metagenome TaxID=412755 RepID=A0A0F9S2U0_9ZZZZ